MEDDIRGHLAISGFAFLATDGQKQKNLLVDLNINPDASQENTQFWTSLHNKCNECQESQAVDRKQLKVNQFS